MTNPPLADYAMARFMNNSFGAIAYNCSTGRFGYSWSCSSYDQAYQLALAQCGSGSEIAAWGQNTTLALAKGSDGSWGCGFNASRRRAKKAALQTCGRHGQNARIVLVLQTLRGVEEIEQ